MGYGLETTALCLKYSRLKNSLSCVLLVILRFKYDKHTEDLSPPNGFDFYLSVSWFAIVVAF